MTNDDLAKIDSLIAESERKLEEAKYPRRILTGQEDTDGLTEAEAITRLPLVRLRQWELAQFKELRRILESTYNASK